jgi:hypothetical protein
MLYQETMLLLHPSDFMEEVMTIFDFDLDQFFDFDQSNLDFDHHPLFFARLMSILVFHALPRDHASAAPLLFYGGSHDSL